MARTLDAGTLAAIQADTNMQMFHLITIYFSTTQRLTDHSHDVSYNFGAGAETFSSTGRMMGLSEVEEEQGISNPSINFSISGANAADIALMLTENYTNARLLIRRGFYDSTGATKDTNIAGSPFIIFDGRISSWSFSDDPSTGESVITYEVSSHWVEWERTNGRKSNNQNARTANNNEFPNDSSFDFTYDRIGDRVWGKVG